jgi:hypothetical protein
MQRIDEEQLSILMEHVREIGRKAYPSPMWARAYQYPNHYPPATRIKDSILEPLGVFLYGVRMWREGAMSGGDLEQQTASFMVRHKAYQQEFPTYLVTPTLVQMLMQTDKLEEPNIDKDSKPPFDAAFFVLPKHLIGTNNGWGYATSLGYAILTKQDTEGTPVHFPEDVGEGARKLYVVVEMSDGTGYYAKLNIDDDGNVESPASQPYTDLIEDKSVGVALSRPNDAAHHEPAFVIQDGPAMLEVATNLVLSLCTYPNMDHEQSTVQCEERTGIAKQKRNKSYKEFWSPAIIGINLHPTGVATQGTHASPHAHLRRGHWRRQHFGKNREEVRRVWIKPVLVMGKQ